MNLGGRIKMVLDALGRNQAWLCEQVPKLETQTLSALINRDSEKSKFALAIATATGGRIEYLMHGEEPMFTNATNSGVPLPHNAALAAQGSRLVPVLDFVQAGRMTEVANPAESGDAQEWVQSDRKGLSLRAFALRIKGDSMLERFKPGDLIIVDPAIAPTPGQFVVASTVKKGEEGKDATFKQYKLIGYDDNGNDVFDLVPLNDSFPTLHSSEQPLSIIGKVVQHIEVNNL